MQESDTPTVTADPGPETQDQEFRLTPSGIRPLDHRLGGMLPGRPHVISGNPGTGKSVSCIEFVQRGIEAGDKSLLITHDDPADVLASAAFLGIDLERALRDEKLILLRYQLDFVRRLGRATSPEAAFNEIRGILGEEKVERIAIDSIVPILDAGPGSSMAVHSLIQMLDEMQATSLITYPGDMTGMYDRRLEPLMQRAAGVFHLSSDSERNHKLEVRKIRYQAPSTRPVLFRVMSGAGMVVIADPDGATPRLSGETAKRLVLVNMADPMPAELLSSMRQHYEVDVRTGIFAAFSDLVKEGAGALLISVRRDVIDAALQLIRDMRSSNNTVPVVLVTPYVLRSADRTRALRAGADDFLSSSLAPAELVARLETIVQRGHWHDLVSATPEPTLILQPTAEDSSYVPMSARTFEHTLRAYLQRDRVPFFSLFLIRQEKGSSDDLARLVLDIVRVESGDLVGTLDDRVATFLDSARPKDLVSLKTRLREQALRRGFGELEIEALGFPMNEEAIRALAGAGQPS